MMAGPVIARSAALAALNLWIAWRYSRLPLGEDEGLWMLWGFTGARPYLDDVDCKPPGIHLWLWLLARLSGRKIRLTKFLQHAAVGGFAIAAYRLSGSLNAGLIFTALAQSAWLRAYHAPLETTSAGFLLLALLLDPWPATICLALAVLFNLKLGPPGLLYMLLHGWWPELGAAALAATTIFALWILLWPSCFRAVAYGCITVSRRLVRTRQRGGQRIVPRWDPYLVTPMLLVVPAVCAAILARPDPILWTVAAAYIAVNLQGRVWRPYHWIPLAAFAAAAAPSAAILFLLADWITNGVYLGNVIDRTQPGTLQLGEDARAVGEALRLMRGALWVQDEQTQIYIYAGKRPAGPVEQVEIRHVIPERKDRREQSRQQIDLLVLGPDSIPFAPRGFRTTLVRGPFAVLTRPTDAPDP